MEIWQHVNAWILGLHDFNFQTHFQISFPNSFTFQAQHPQKMLRKHQLNLITFYPTLSSKAKVCFTVFFPSYLGETPGCKVAELQGLRSDKLLGRFDKLGSIFDVGMR